MLMRVTKDSERYFTAVFRAEFSWVTLVIVVSFFLIFLMGGVSTSIAMRRVADDRVNVVVEKKLFGAVFDHLEVRDVAMAGVEGVFLRRVRYGSGRWVPLLFLDAAGGRFQVQPPFGLWRSAPQWDEFATEINGFVQNSSAADDRRIGTGVYWLPLIVGGAMLMLVMSYLLRFGRYVIDGNRRELRFFDSRCCFPTERVFAFDEVRLVDIVDRRVCVQRQDGEWLTFGPIYDGDVIEQMIDRAGEMLGRFGVGAQCDGASKRCAICGEDCSSEPRAVDHVGNYYHQRCYSGA